MSEQDELRKNARKKDAASASEKYVACDAESSTQTEHTTQFSDAVKEQAHAVRDMLSSTMTPPQPATTKPSPLTPQTTDKQPLTKGEIRLAQAYLRVMDYYGKYEDVPPASVVNGIVNARTKSVFSKFISEHQHDVDARIPLTSNGYYTKGFLRAVRAVHEAHFAALQTGIVTESYSDATLHRLESAFQKKYGDDKYYQILSTLHPALRFPAMEALTDLRDKKVSFVVDADTNRSVAEQENHVKAGRSFSPPGYSFHAYGLAMDITPADGKTGWNTINTTMEKHGFYSIYLNDGWDRPHHELTAKTREMVKWPVNAVGWKDIPMTHVPLHWQELNREALKLAQEQRHTTPKSNGRW